jgi:folate-binding protein YgfZ
MDDSMSEAPGTTAHQYDAVCKGAGVVDRADRGLIGITGRDRQAWLHNLVTNNIKALAESEGCYAFAADVRGRVQFDMNVLSLRDSLWVDVDVTAILRALDHLKRYKIAEDVSLADETPDYGRIGVCGAASAAIATALAVAEFGRMRALSSITIGDGTVRLFRHDFVGLAGFELVLPRSAVDEWSERLVRDFGARRIGLQTVDVLRVEAGIPWWGRDIDEKTLPPETGQIERGISYHKGCYLGQEVIERMRSHNVLARRLVKLRMLDGSGITLPAALRNGDVEAGRVTSLVRHPRDEDWIGLGYLRTAVKDAGGLTVGDTGREVRVV